MVGVSLAKPRFTEKDLDSIGAEIRRVLQSGWLTSGEHVERLETQFAAFLGSRNAVAVNSGTSALHSILMALKIGTGDEVILPTNTFVGSANPIIHLGARPVFVDCDARTLNIDPEKVQDAISARTKAVMVVHMGGNPCDMKELVGIARASRIHLIEDAAHAHGAKYEGRSCGTFGKAAGFSLSPTKVITSGEGGIVTTNDRVLAENVRAIRNEGRLRAGPSDVITLGHSFRMSDILAVVGLSQLSHISEFIARRNLLARKYDQVLERLGWLTPQFIKPGNLSSRYAYIAILEHDAPVDRDGLMLHLKKMGIETTILFRPLHLQPYFRKMFGFKGGEFPESERIGRMSIAFPMGNAIRNEDLRYISNCLVDLSGYNRD